MLHKTSIVDRVAKPLALKLWNEHRLMMVLFLASLCILFLWWQSNNNPPVISGFGQNKPISAQQNNPGIQGSSSANTSPPLLPISGSASPDQRNVSFAAVVFSEGLYTTERDQLLADMEVAFAYVREREPFRMVKPSLFTVAIADDPACAVSGFTNNQDKIVQVNTCNSVVRAQAISILAHEFVHRLAADKYGADETRADGILSEGLATLVAGKYWVGEPVDFRAYVRSQYGSQLKPLDYVYERGDFKSQNQMYYQWASFVEFLVQKDNGNWKRFDDLYRTRQNGQGRAGYLQIYGLELSALEQEWRAWLGIP